MESVRTTCPYCGVGCGILARAAEGQAEIKGDPEHPANRGRLCSKGANLAETLTPEGRLLHPIVHGRRASWDRALGLVARRMAACVRDHGPDSVGFYLSGQLLTEDYYVANKLMKGFIGSANVDTNSRLCMSSAVAAHVRAFGEDIVPAGYDDLDQADLVVLIGSNAAWCHPVLHQRILAAREARGTRIVVVDPRRTETAEEADLHLALRPGTDIALINGLLAHCRRSGLVDDAYIARSVHVPDGFWSSIEQAGDPWSVARACDLAPADVQAFFRLFAERPRTVTLFSQGINQSVRGTDQANAILNLHLATGRIGRPGAAPFSITGQPNAMGGREVGGLATSLAAHMDFGPDNVERLRRFWAAPNVASKPGLKAVDLFRAVRDGRVRMLWIMATNPAVSLPDAGEVRSALARCPFLVVSDCIAETDTSRFAHVKLPAAAWGEKDGTVTNSERRISRQRPFLSPPGEARPDWWIVAEVARRMGWGDAFAYRGPADIYREHVRLCAYQNDGQRRLDLGRHAGLSDAGYAAMEPWQWGGRPFADGRFPTADGKARLVAMRPARPEAPLARWPLLLNSGRYRDQWHSMTRTGLSPRLARHRPEPFVEIAPADAEAAGIAEGDLVRVATPQAASLFRARLTDRHRPGELFVPIHWTDRQATGGRTGLLTRPLVDPHSGQPGFKATPAAIAKAAVDWHGFLVARTLPAAIGTLYAVRIRLAGGWLVELAGSGDPAPQAERLLPAGHRVEANDAARRQLRIVVEREGKLEGALLIGRPGSLPPREWLIGQLAGDDEAASAAEWLAGRPLGARPAAGPMLCACFEVTADRVAQAIAEHDLGSVEQVGSLLRAGSNCGACRPEIRALLRRNFA
ncbi:nitrate reductase [Sphingosinicella terrae]|uniref:nitrate reductase n=1 Tax=Sphingosinicella terrae TaxID=2172047 RepID=UPI000E0DC508|nr:nitrate reductase [Sphingosinicella terrae]